MGIWDDVIAGENEDEAAREAISDIALLTPLSHMKIKELYEDDDEKKALASALKEVREATEWHEKQSRLANRASDFLRLLQRLGVAV